LLALPEPPTAIFAASDLQAIGVLKAAEHHGARVPEDLAVIGFDDVDLAEIVGLTTIRQPLREGGALAADLLLAAIEKRPGEPVEITQTLTVVERRTT
jgi:DNA-binding LacI/PurR family transcriptional regulator